MSIMKNIWGATDSGIGKMATSLILPAIVGGASGAVYGRVSENHTWGEGASRGALLGAGLRFGANFHKVFPSMMVGGIIGGGSSFFGESSKNKSFIESTLTGVGIGGAAGAAIGSYKFGTAILKTNNGIGKISAL